MPEPDASVYLVLAIAVVAVIGLGLSVASFVTDRSVQNMMGPGGMMNGTGGSGGSAAGPGAFEWAVLILSVVLVAVAILLLWRTRMAPANSPATPAPATTAAPPAVVPSVSPSASAPAPGPVAPTPVAAVPEPALVKLLDEDERRMYLEIRSHGGEMLQRDLVALGIFSKAKVTRVLDKLEAKGIVVREAHGMTNRVRLVGAASR